METQEGCKGALGYPCQWDESFKGETRMNEETKRKIKTQLRLGEEGNLYCKHNTKKPCKNCLKNITGNISWIRGDVSRIRGNVSGIRGDVSRIHGDVSEIESHTSDILKVLKENK